MISDWRLLSTKILMQNEEPGLATLAFTADKYTTNTECHQRNIFNLAENNRTRYVLHMIVFGTLKHLKVTCPKWYCSMSNHLVK